jgi:hypothetical protein
MSSQKCFISYSWESENHKSWVRQLATDLQRNGVYVLLDQWDLKLGADITNYMESSIRESDFVLLVCTPSFAKKANEGKGGVGYEKSIVTGEIFNNAAIETKFVPILKYGSAEESLPSYLKSRLFVDFREEKSYQASLTELLRHFFKSPEFERPKLGEKPNLKTTTDIIAPQTGKDKKQRRKTKHSEFDLTKFKNLVAYASQIETLGGLGYSKDDAVAWALQKL